MRTTLVLNGPNLDRLGKRQPEIYGSQTLDDIESTLVAKGVELGIQVECRHSNHVGELIDWINYSDHDGIVINPGALSHTSHALADSIRSVPRPVVEVHVSNIREREPWRAVSLVAPACVRSIYGRGIRGYVDAIRHLVNRTAHPFETIRYGPHPDNIGDLRRGGEGLVVLVHGGFWRHEWSLDTMETLAVDLTRRGLNTWNVEYRRLGDGGGWPGSAHDVLMALDFVPQLGLQTGSISVMGHSAGGHLGIWAANRTSTEFSRLVGLAPLIELDRHAGSQLFGASECSTLLDSGAPARITPEDLSTTLVHGASDSVVPVEHSLSLEGTQGVQVITPDIGHFGILDAEESHWEEIAGRLAP